MKNIKNKILYISGGGDEKDSYLLDKEFVQDVIKAKKSVLYIPIAMDDNVHSYESCYDWVTNSFSSVGGGDINITMWTDLNNKNGKNLDGFDAIYVGGGNTFKLLQHIYDSNFFSTLKEFFDKGGIVYGGSAGAIIMGKNINTVLEENDKNYKHDKGLSAIGDYSIICHYQKSLDEQIWQYIKVHNNPVIALTERTGLKIVSGKAKVIGCDPVVIFNLNNQEILVECGSEFII